MYGGGSSLYGGGGYGSSGMYGGGMYGRPGMYGGGGMYGSGMYGGGMYGGMGGPGMYGGVGGMMGGPMQWDPNDPNGPPAPPTAWQAMMAGVGGIMHFFGRLSFLVDENAHAVHFFVTALLQLLDRFGSLYGELARFVLRLLGFRPKENKMQQQGGAIVPGGPQQQQQQHHGHAMPRHPVNGAAGGPWDGVWGGRR
jgi:peroxin-13